MYVQDNLGMCDEVVESLARYASGRDYRPFTVCGTHRPYQLVPSRGFLPVEKHVIQHILRLHLLYCLQGFDPLDWMVARPVTENVGEELDVLQVVIPDFVSLFEPYSRIRVNPWATTVELLHVVNNQLVVGMLRLSRLASEQFITLYPSTTIVFSYLGLSHSSLSIALTCLKTNG